jgi:branched-subunit amino acid transport protein
MDPIWGFVIAGSLVVFALKLAGYLVSQRLVEGPALSRVAALVTVALLASLVVSQTLGDNGSLVLDARVPAVAAAGALLWLRAPFIVVIVAAAVIAGLLRLLFGMP